MATTARLPEGLKQEAETYARSLGVSLNALLAVALRDYLDARRGLVGVPVPPAAVAQPVPVALPADVAALVAMAQPAAVRVQQAAPGASMPDWSVQPAQGRRALCGCGSLKKWKDCHGRPAKPLTISRAIP